MAINNLRAHVLETTRSIISSDELAKERRIRKATIFLKRVTLLFLAISVAVLFVFAQAHQRAKVERIAVMEGKIPAITITRGQ